MENPIYTYTEEQAIEDGVLFDISLIEPDCPINIITTNFLNKLGIINEKGIFNVDEIRSLLLFVYLQVKDQIHKNPEETFFSGMVNNEKWFCIENETTNNFTLMLAEDYYNENNCKINLGQNQKGFVP